MRMEAAWPPETDSAGSFSTNAWSVLRAIFSTPRNGGWTLKGTDLGALFGATDGTAAGFTVAGAGATPAGGALVAVSVEGEVLKTVPGAALRVGSEVDGDATVAEVETATPAGGVNARTPALTKFWSTGDTLLSLEGSDGKAMEFAVVEIAGGVVVVLRASAGAATVVGATPDCCGTPGDVTFTGRGINAGCLISAAAEPSPIAGFLSKLFLVGLVVDATRAALTFLNARAS